MKNAPDKLKTPILNKAVKEVSSRKSNSLIRGMLIGSVCGMIVGALATTLAGRTILNLVGKLWNKITRQEEGVDFRWLLQ